jgi:hypothetical protein
LLICKEIEEGSRPQHYKRMRRIEQDEAVAVPPSRSQHCLSPILFILKAP